MEGLANDRFGQVGVSMGDFKETGGFALRSGEGPATPAGCGSIVLLSVSGFSALQFDGFLALKL
jgi:hypothetical protein